MVPINVCVALVDGSKGFGLKNKLPWPHINCYTIINAVGIFATSCFQIAPENDLRIMYLTQGDYEYYTHLTQWTSDPSKKVVQIKGRRTWMLTTEKEKEAASVINVIISSTLREDSHRSLHKVVSSFDEAVDYALSGPRRHEIEAVWVMGGTRVYENAINHPLCKRLYLTRVFGNFDADVFFPEFENKFRKISLPNVDGEPREDNGVRYQFEVYERLRDIV